MTPPAEQVKLAAPKLRTVLAADLGIGPMMAASYLDDSTDVVDTESFVAVLRGNVVHLAIRISGLGGRRVLNECEAILDRWFKTNSVLYAPVRHGNDKAIAVAERLGFTQYSATPTHVWLKRERGNQ